MHPSEFEKFRESPELRDFSRNDLKELHSLISELKTLQRILNNKILPALRVYGQSTGHNPDTEYGGKHPASQAQPEKLPNDAKAKNDYDKTWENFNPTFSILSETFIEKTSRIPLNKTAGAPSTIGQFIAELKRDGSSVRAPLNTTELATNLHSSITRLEIIMDRLAQ